MTSAGLQPRPVTRESAACNDMLEGEQRVPYRRLEPAAQKFAKVVIPTDLERLRNHQINIEKYRRLGSWEELHKEHIHAGRTVLLRANMQDMETLFLRVRKEDTEALRKVLQPVKDTASASISDFLEIHSKALGDLHEKNLFDMPNNVDARDPSGSSSKLQIDAQLIQIPHPNASESWNTLEKDLLDLNEIINEFSHLVHTQQEKIDSIEDHVNTAAVNVEEGTKNLGKALKYKLSLLPAAGALIGGIVGGPIGLMAGFKVAGVAAALGGGLLGFTGGKVLQRKKENVEREQEVPSIEANPQEAEREPENT
ncbi:syntaxin-17 isoform X2 [Eleutherodactylus coqui]|uniref:syntaxin-17 isoform X2 n=1 Tax=Eleutherodactylus coqui TaxID=57060 RepID=UPI0034637A81